MPMLSGRLPDRAFDASSARSALESRPPRTGTPAWCTARRGMRAGAASRGMHAQRAGQTQAWLQRGRDPRSWVIRVNPCSSPHSARQAEQVSTSPLCCTQAHTPRCARLEVWDPAAALAGQARAPAGQVGGTSSRACRQAAVVAGQEPARAGLTQRIRLQMQLQDAAVQVALPGVRQRGQNRKWVGRQLAPSDGAAEEELAQQGHGLRPALKLFQHCLQGGCAPCLRCCAGLERAGAGRTQQQCAHLPSPLRPNARW